MISNIGVHLKVKDFNKSLAFYSALGFKKVFEYGPGKTIAEDYNGAVFEQNGAKLEIADGHRAVKSLVFKQSMQSSKISLMLNVNNIGEIIKRANKAGIKIAVGPRHYYWGTLEIVIKDPDGIVLVFISPYSKELAKRINTDEKFAKKT
ncbi:MAG: VOC family protein [Candidatus Levybacteria bacterium]|nr:VOC family protein [Candidatus Levybacteria bacterium]